MNFQEAYWFGTNTSRQQQHQNPLASPSNRDPTRPKSMSSNPVSYHHIHQVDDEFPDHHDDRQSTTTTSATRAAHDQYYTVDREPMFEKPLTPSDVGKLNRLVIPKQHAEKYFPLNGSGGESAPSGEKGLVLSFEDESGKNWRFRYSYWNSSQSYVLTKGWSRFVKEKRLDAGDVVLFERNRSDLERFFIGWRRRGVGGGNVTASATAAGAVVFHGEGVVAAPSGSGGGWGGTMWYNARPSAPQQGYPRVTHGVPVANYQQLVAGHEYPHLRTGTYVHNEKAPPAAAAAASSGSKNSSKRKLRLFGVNLECHLDVDADYSPEPQTSDASSLSSGGGAPDGGGGGASAGRGSGSRSTAANNPATSYYYYDYVGYPSSNHHHMVRN